MERIDTDHPDVFMIAPKLFGDERGFFMETFRVEPMRAMGIEGPFIQDNHSRSPRGVLRGLHYQIQHSQGKLVRVVSGAVFDVAVDIRRSSAHFGKWVGMYLSAENRRMAWIPRGFAHGFLALEDGTDFLYKVDDIYAPDFERTIAWNDPALAIDWPLEGIGEPIVSAKDAPGTAPGLDGAEVFP